MKKGDPACDLVIAWTLFEGKSREAFCADLPAVEAMMCKALITVGGHIGINLVEFEKSWHVVDAVLADHARGREAPNDKPLQPTRTRILSPNHPPSHGGTRDILAEVMLSRDLCVPIRLSRRAITSPASPRSIERRHGGIVFQRLAAVTISDATALQGISIVLEEADRLGSVIPLFASVSEWVWRCASSDDRGGRQDSGRFRRNQVDIPHYAIILEIYNFRGVFSRESISIYI
ncbi:hypothetical protein [Mesorhizobium sp. M7A.F.Ca.US.008.03.1.1]|uniref:hypothetical protein n=1 Tax=Mesorhizobium sp. M7A.F.Ca.US.008.03.1.1 TaxID=2496742 RepID=UPI001FDFD03A|nr:hypothetical protein [Mesorhizobium sp. M7A.F.Ca.US.008.03.1.1]